MKQCIKPPCLRSQWIKKRFPYLCVAVLAIATPVLVLSISAQFKAAKNSFQEVESQVFENQFAKKRLAELDEGLQQFCFNPQKFQGDSRETTRNSCLTRLRVAYFYSSSSKSKILDEFVLAWEDLIDQRFLANQPVEIRDYNVRKTAVSDRAFNYYPYLAINDPDGSKYAAFVESLLAEKRQNLNNYDPLKDAIVQRKSEQVGAK